MQKQPHQKQKSPKNAVSAAAGEVSAAAGGGQVTRQFQQQTFAGPMPPPAILQGYEAIVPGAAERILAMAEADTKHQHAIEFAALAAAEGEVKRGQWFGFGIGALALICSIVALLLGSSTVAAIIGGSTVVGLVSVFIIGRVVKPKQE